MITYTRELTVAWGGFDPFGLAHYPMMFTWFNEVEHDLLRELGFSTNRLIEKNRTAFVMGAYIFASLARPPMATGCCRPFIWRSSGPLT